MQRGPKKKSVEVKQATGTFRPYRDNPKHLIVDTSKPLAPTYLTDAAMAVWIEELPRVMQAGTCDLDSSLFARYCSLEAHVRDSFKNGELPKATNLVELRKMGEQLGIGGVSSRAQRGIPAEVSTGNAFADLMRV